MITYVLIYFQHTTGYTPVLESASTNYTALVRMAKADPYMARNGFKIFAFANELPLGYVEFYIKADGTLDYKESVRFNRMKVRERIHQYNVDNNIEEG
jgi:hypothetical protein